MSDDFPYLELDQYFNFPEVVDPEDDIVAVGGNLSPGMLFSA